MADQANESTPGGQGAPDAASASKSDPSATPPDLASADKPAPITPIQPPSTAAIWFLRALALAALAISVYLTVQTWRGSALAGCEPGSPCDRVLTSRWSKWFGAVPVSLPATFIYAGFLLASAFALRPDTARAAWRAMLGLGVTILGAAAWFMAIQWFKIGVFCPYCTTAHALGVGLGVITLIAAPRPRTAALRPAAPIALTAAALLAALIIGQTAFAPRTHRIVNFQGISIRADMYPIIGSPDAPHVFVYLFDYTCPNCRLLHKYMNHARDKYPGQFAVALGLVPLDADCNPKYEETEPEHENACEYAKLAMAVWHAKPDALASYDEYLMTGAKPPPIEEARMKAAELVGDARLAEIMRQDWAGEFIKMQIQLNDLLRKRAREMGHEVGSGVPTLVMGAGVFMAGRPERPEQLFEAIEQAMALPTVPQAIKRPATRPALTQPASR